MVSYRNTDTKLTSMQHPAPAGAGAKRKRASREDIAWTAARCNRLLRTISSRISILRNLATRNGLQGSLDNAAFEKHEISPAISTRGATRSIIIPAITTRDGDDPDWLPMPTSGKPLRTYGGRSKGIKTKPVLENCQPDTGFKTPFIKRMLKPSSERSPLDIASPSIANMLPGNKARSHYSRKLPLKPSSSAEEANRNLVFAFETLLKATAPVQVPSRNGARSLLDTCLRKVPELIESEQIAGADDDQVHPTDIALEFYSDLEGHFGSGCEAGWSGLRQVVRAHGVRLISTAIQEGLIKEIAVFGLIAVCRRHKALTELRDLLDVAMEVFRPRKKLVTNICVAQREFGQSDLGFQTLGKALRAKRILPADVIDRSSLWQEALRSLTKDPKHTSAIGFLNDFVLTCVDGADDDESPTRDHGLPNVVDNVAIMLTAIAAGSCDAAKAPDTTTSNIAQLIHSVASTAILSSSSPRDAISCAGTNRHVLPFLISSLVLHALNMGFDENLTSLSVDRLAERLGACGQLGPDLICGVAQYTSHLGKDASYELIKAILRGLLRTSASLETTAASAFVKQLALDAAFANAETCNDKRSITLAEEIEEAVSNLHNSAVIQTPVSGRIKPKRFRWEDSISEWVVVAPNAVVPMEKQRRTDEPSVHDSGICLDFDKEDEKEDLKDEAIAVESLKAPSGEAVLQNEVDFPPEASSDSDGEDELTSAIPLPKRPRALSPAKAPTRHNKPAVRNPRHRSCLKPSKIVRVRPFLDDDLSADELE